MRGSVSGCGSSADTQVGWPTGNHGHHWPFFQEVQSTPNSHLRAEVFYPGGRWWWVESVSPRNSSLSWLSCSLSRYLRHTARVRLGDGAVATGDLRPLMRRLGGPQLDHFRWDFLNLIRIAQDRPRFQVYVQSDDPYVALQLDQLQSLDADWVGWNWIRAIRNHEGHSGQDINPLWISFFCPGGLWPGKAATEVPQISMALK